MTSSQATGRPPAGARGSGRGTRRLSRLLAVQGIYQHLLAGEQAAVIQTYLEESEEHASCDAAYFQDCLHGVLSARDALTDALLPALDRPLVQVSPVEQAILLLGCHELQQHPEVPYRVVINEAVELSKSLGGNEGHRYVNGVLDRLLSSLRPHESRDAAG